MKTPEAKRGREINREHLRKTQEIAGKRKILFVAQAHPFRRTWERTETGVVLGILQYMTSWAASCYSIPITTLATHCVYKSLRCHPVTRIREILSYLKDGTPFAPPNQSSYHKCISFINPSAFFTIRYPGAALEGNGNELDLISISTYQRIR